MRRRSHAAPDDHRPGSQQIDWSWAPEHRLGLAAAVIVIVALGGIISWRVGWQPWLPADLFFVAFAGVIALGDLYTHRIPNRLVLPALVVGTALFAAACIPSEKWSPAGRSLLAGALLFAFYALFAFKGAMGAGDAKFAALVGEVLGWIGWAPFWIGVLAGLVAAFAATTIMIGARHADRRTRVPFAPSIYLGAAIVICFAGR